MRLFADDTVAAHFLNLAIGIGDEPVPPHQASRKVAIIADGDGVREYESRLIRVGLFSQIAGLHVYRDSVGAFLHQFY